MSVYRGKLRINDVLAGKTEAMAGDTFVDETVGCGFLAFQYTPLPEGSKGNPHMNFKLLHRGTFHNCERAASLTAEGVEL